MIFEEKTIILKDGRTAILKSPCVEDAEKLLNYIKKSCSETDFLARYPEEWTTTIGQEEAWVNRLRSAPDTLGMFYALKKMGMCARAPHAFLPMLLCDSVPSERAIALKFGIELLERSDVLLVCGNRISNGMKSEIANAAMLRMPIIVFDDMLYLEVQKLVTQKNGDKKTVKLESNHIPMSLSNPISYMEQAAMFK